MVNKASLLCILVAFVMCSLAQDTTTLDTTALDTTTQDTPTQDITPTTTTSGDIVVLNTGLDQNGNFDPLTSVDQENHVWDDSPEVNGVVINASTPFPQSLINYMASREMRYHHFMWHQIREGWLNFSAEVQANYASLGWTPPHPARNFTNGTVTSIPDNGSGQDFLYMHRDMLNRAKAVLAENNETYIITGWETLPAPGDLDWPVPENYSIPNDLITQNSTDQWKLDSSYQFLQQAEKNYKDPDYLRNMTLDELGAQIEVTLHVWLHMRWSQNCSVGYRRSYINKNNMTYMDKKWDDPANDWLIDTYSSHVNPAFYKLHGWIDDRVEDWRMAHNLTEIIWNGTWTGGPWSTVSGILMSKQSHLLRGSAPENQNPGMTGMAGMDHSGSGNMDILDAVFKVFVDSGVPEITFADTVLVAPPPPRS